MQERHNLVWLLCYILFGFNYRALGYHWLYVVLIVVGAGLLVSGTICFVRQMHERRRRRIDRILWGIVFDFVAPAWLLVACWLTLPC